MMIILQWKEEWFGKNIGIMTSRCHNSDDERLAVEEGWFVAYIRIMTL
jgi:hypothetical protein